MSPRIRLILACALFSSWMILLMTGFVLRGWTHLLMVASLALFPWNGSEAGKNGSETDVDAPR